MNARPFFGFHACPQLFSPFGISVCQHVYSLCGRLYVHGDVRIDLSSSLFYLFDVFVVALQLIAFGLLERAHTFEHLVPINQSAIKFRAIYTNKLGFSANGESACATHSRTVYHDGVKRNVGGNVVFLGE